MAVLPALVDRLETVTVGIENVRSVITGIVIQARAGLAVVGRARRHCCLVERVHLGFALGDKANMLPSITAISNAISDALLIRVHDTILRCRINAAFRSQVERRIYAAEWVREEICPAPPRNQAAI